MISSERPLFRSHRLQHAHQLLHRRNLLVGNQDVRLFELRLHLFGIGHEVGRDITAVELHALDHLDMGLGSLGLLDGDDTLVVDLGHRLGDQLTDRLVVVGRNGGHLLDLGEIRADLLALLPQRLHDRRNGLVDTAFQVHRVGSGRHVLQTDADDRLRQHGCGGRTVARIVVGLRSDLADHLGAHVGESVLQFHLLGHRHTVLGDLRSTEFLVDNHVAAFGTERDLYGVRQRIDTLLEQLARLNIVFDILCHNVFPLLDDR